MAKSFVKFSVVSALGCSAAMLLSACGSDNISIVRDGYFDFESKKSIGEVFSMCSYTKEGNWHERTLNGIDVPAVVYTATIPNETLVSWVIPEASEQKKKAVLEHLKDTGFNLQAEFAFNVFKNKSFELTFAQLKFNGHNIQADKETQDFLLLSVVNNQDISSMKVNGKVSGAFRYALAKAMLKNDAIEDSRIASLIGTQSRTFGTALIFKQDQVQNSFGPLTFSEVTDIKGNDKALMLTMEARSTIIDINDMALNEYGQTLFSDNYGILGGSTLKSYDDITALISAYDYKPLLKRDMELTASFADESTTPDVVIADMELGDLVLKDAQENEVAVNLSGDVASLRFSPDVSNQRPLLDYLDKQQELIEYTAVAYPVIFGASLISSLTGVKDEESMVKKMVQVRNKVMTEAGTQPPEPLKKSGRI